MAPTWLLYVVGLGLVAGGLLAGRVGHQRRETHGVLTRATPTRIDGIRGEGLVALAGEVLPAPEAPARSVPDAEGGTFSSPIGGEAGSVVSAWQVQQWVERGDYGHWKRAARGYRSHPFYLDDGAGQVLVDPGSEARASYDDPVRLGSLESTVTVSDAVIDLGPFGTERYVSRRAGETPGAIERFRESVSVLDEPSGPLLDVTNERAAHGDRKYREATLSVGDTVTVVGYARPDTGSAGGSPMLANERGAGDTDRPLRARETVVGQPPDETPFVLSWRDRESLLGATGGGNLLYRGGVVVMLAGLALLGTTAAGLL